MASLMLQDLGLPPAALKAVGKKAREAGKTTSEYVRWLVERDLLAEQSFDELLRPIRADVRAAGMTQTQLDQIVKRARRATSSVKARGSRR